MKTIETLLCEETLSNQEQSSLNEYLRESLLITKYMSPRIKATNIATYHVLFYLSYGLTGTSEINMPWPEIGKFCGNERGDGVVTKNEAVRSRTIILQDLGCIKIIRSRVGANTIVVTKPSEIPFVIEAINSESKNIAPVSNSIDCYNNYARKIKLLERDDNKCVYCLKNINEESFYIDHIIPRANGGTNYKNNLISACHSCNTKKSDQDIWDFLKETYRQGLLDQGEYLKQKQYIESICASDTGEP